MKKVIDFNIGDIFIYYGRVCTLETNDELQKVVIKSLSDGWSGLIDWAKPDAEAEEIKMPTTPKELWDFVDRYNGFMYREELD